MCRHWNDPRKSFAWLSTWMHENVSNHRRRLQGGERISRRRPGRRDGGEHARRPVLAVSGPRGDRLHDVRLRGGVEFIRAEGFVFSHVADEGLVHACAGELLRYRKSVGAEDILVFTDIKKKHSSHALTSDVSVAETARAAEFFLSDGLILTGTSTGAQADPQELTEVSRAVSIPVLIGSGVTHDNVDRYLGASGVIVGSHFKDGGVWSGELNPRRVRNFMTKMRRLRGSAGP
ncbi:uncharacterized protein F13E9.13, mitochondrial isoform X3 [Syngnathoides biaculeatus]|uniref:uncharacterized protein F13E9.13, mitochondrial isoform X3 n=1 Tax=Syngnathoides biaculeatus TaxID=300417 RepID=UPI002ADD483D|nr:uncharacterized protein F13E9.13, mitochondrial isoform X3 [Syngnathoides biaculeatus]